MFSSPRAVQTLDTHFWLYHFWLPLLFVVPTLYLFEYTSIDTVFADFWYQLEGGTGHCERTGSPTKSCIVGVNS